MKAFNALQLTTLFACGPFILEWLRGEPFTCAAAIFWVCVVAYVLGFIGVCVAVHDQI